MLKKIFFISALIIAGCAAPNHGTHNIQPNADKKIKGNFEVSYKKKYQGEYYILLEKLNNKWDVIKTSKTPIKRPNKNSEILTFNKELSYTQPYYDRAPYFNGNTFECSAWGKYDQRDEYVPCNSQLVTTNIGKSIGKNALAAFMTLGLASGSHVQVDKDKVINAIDESGAIAILSRDKEVFDQENERDRNKIKREIAEAQNLALENDLNHRKAMLSRTKTIGNLICKNDKFTIGYHSSEMEHVGYVERVEGDKIQIRTKYARFRKNKEKINLINYQESIIWDDALNWLPCTN